MACWDELIKTPLLISWILDTSSSVHEEEKLEPEEKLEHDTIIEQLLQFGFGIKI